MSHILRKAFIFYLLEEFVEDRSENSKSTFIIIYCLSMLYKPINSTYKKARGAQQFILNSLRNMYWRRISLGLKCLNPIVDPWNYLCIVQQIDPSVDFNEPFLLFIKTFSYLQHSIFSWLSTLYLIFFFIRKISK